MSLIEKAFAWGRGSVRELLAQNGRSPSYRSVMADNAEVIGRAAGKLVRSAGLFAKKKLEDIERTAAETKAAAATGASTPPPAPTPAAPVAQAPAAPVQPAPVAPAAAVPPVAAHQPAAAAATTAPVRGRKKRKVRPAPLLHEIPSSGAAYRVAWLLWLGGVLAIVLTIVNIDVVIGPPGPRAVLQFLLAATFLAAGYAFTTDIWRLRQLAVARILRSRRAGFIPRRQGKTAHKVLREFVTLFGIIFLALSLFDLIRGINGLR